jgi:tRNA-2-methylthio-N6-dimethylallyladenosine synthase
MGRGYTVAEYHGLVERLRAARPELALSTDLIVGFPGEDDEDFEATAALVKSVKFASFYAFKYSPRPGTAAPRLPLPTVPEEVADERLQRLFRLQEPIQREQNERLVGTALEALTTGWGREPGTQTGRTACHRVVHFPAGESPVPLGRLAALRVEQALPHSLVASRL